MQYIVAVLIVVVVIMGGYGVLHKHPPADAPTADAHTHHIYLTGSPDHPAMLFKIANKKFGIPKEGVKHRHSGADYIQHGLVTYKHVDDQHVKLSDEISE